MATRFTTTFILGLLAALFGCTGTPRPVPAPVPATSGPDREAVTLRMVQLARAGRVVEARDEVRRYLAERPTDGVVLYNLACLDLLLGEREQALTDLESALASGYTNFRLMEKDRSLSPLRDDGRFQALVQRYEADLLEVFEARAVSLEEGYPRSGLPLTGQSTARAELELAFDREALRVAVDAVDPGPAADGPPWAGGSGVLINLIRRLSLDDYESQRYHSVGLGVVDGEPGAWLVAHDGRILNRPLPEARVSVETTGKGRRWVAALPWSVFRPYAPPLDPAMGLNVIVLGAGSDADRTQLALMPEQHSPFRAGAWRRFVPLDFRESDRSEPVLRGRVYDRLVEGETVDAEAVVWASRAGAGTVRVGLTDRAGREVPGFRESSRPIEWAEGLNFLDESVSVEELPTGDYRFHLCVDGPDGRLEAVDEPFARFAPDWLEGLNRRIHAMASPEGQILKYHLFRLAQGLDRRHPQDPVDGLGERYERLRAGVAAVEGGGSVLPDAGPALGGFAVDTMNQRLCALHLPAGWRLAAERRVLVVLPTAPETEQALAADVGAAWPEHVVLVPQSHGHTGLDRERAARQTLLAVSWARDLFGVERVTMAGLGAGADAALVAGVQGSENFDHLILDADGLFLDVEPFSADVVRSALGPEPAGLQVSLLARRPDRARLDVLAKVLSEHGCSVAVHERGERVRDAALLAEPIPAP